MGCEQSSTKDTAQPPPTAGGGGKSTSVVTHVSRYPCPFCPQQFTEDKAGSLAHQAAGCSGSRVRCPDCHLECKHSLDLSEHRRMKHPPQDTLVNNADQTSSETLLCPRVEVIQGSQAPSLDWIMMIRRDALVFLNNSTEESVLREIPVWKVREVSIRDQGTRIYIKVQGEHDLLLQPTDLQQGVRTSERWMTMDHIVEALKKSCGISRFLFRNDIVDRDPTHLDPDTLRLGAFNLVAHNNNKKNGPPSSGAYECGCGDSFGSLTLLDDHRDRGDCPDAATQCSNCSMVFPSQFLLHKQHFTPSCANTTRCDSCDLDDIPVDKLSAHLISEDCSALSAAVAMTRGNSLVVNPAASQRMGRKLQTANKKLSNEKVLNQRGACKRAQLTADLDRLQKKVTALEKSRSTLAKDAEAKRDRMEQQQALRQLATALKNEGKSLRAEIARQKKRINVLENGQEIHAMKEAERELEEEALRQGDYILQLKAEASIAEKKAEAAEAEAQAAKDASATADIQFQISEGLHRLAAEFGRGRGKPFCLVNPVMTTSHSAASFFKGVHDLGYATLGELLNHPAHYSVGFHGTKTESALLSILEGGFDTNRRSVQALGPGEYFDTGTGAIAAQYAGDTDCLIVALLVKKARNGDVVAVFTEHKNHRIGSATSDVTVVENPKQGTMSFNLPIAVVSSSDYSLRRIRHQVRDYHFQAPRKVATPYQKEQLYFQNHSGQWLPQCAQVQLQAAEALRNHQKVFDTGKIQVLGYNGEPITFEYGVDLEKMTQQNKDTNVERALRWVGKTSTG